MVDNSNVKVPPKDKRHVFKYILCLCTKGGWVVKKLQNFVYVVIAILLKAPKKLNIPQPN